MNFKRQKEALKFKGYKTKLLINQEEVSSAYEDYPVGCIFYDIGRFYMLIGKKRMSFETCPHCGSKDNWHSNRAFRPGAGNVYRMEKLEHGDGCERITSTAKFNLCFTCGLEWRMEVFLKKYLFDLTPDWSGEK